MRAEVRPPGPQAGLGSGPAAALGSGPAAALGSGPAAALRFGGRTWVSAATCPRSARGPAQDSPGPASARLFVERTVAPLECRSEGAAGGWPNTGGPTPGGCEAVGPAPGGCEARGGTAPGGCEARGGTAPVARHRECRRAYFGHACRRRSRARHRPFRHPAGEVLRLPDRRRPARSVVLVPRRWVAHVILKGVERSGEAAPR